MAIKRLVISSTFMLIAFGFLLGALALRGGVNQWLPLGAAGLTVAISLGVVGADLRAVLAERAGPKPTPMTDSALQSEPESEPDVESDGESDLDDDSAEPDSASLVPAARSGFSEPVALFWYGFIIATYYVAGTIPAYFIATYFVIRNYGHLSHVAAGATGFSAMVVAYLLFDRIAGIPLHRGILF